MPAASLHLCIDMQRMFAERTSWASEGVAKALPGCLAIAGIMPERTTFLRFIPPASPRAAPRMWAAYFERWRDLPLDRLPAELLDLVAPLRELVPPAAVFDKMTFSGFGSPPFVEHLQRQRTEAILVTGVDSDICVLATLLDAIDAGYRCILVEDAIAGPDEPAHRAVVDHIARRLEDFVEIVQIADLVH